MYGLDNYALTYAESWTLSLRRGRAYVIRLRHEADSAGFDNWAGDLVLLGRNPQGDATPLTGWFRAFGDQNANGGMNEELLLSADQDRTVSIRVAAATLADTGRYSLSVESCPAVALNDTTPHPGDTVIAAFTTASCQMELNIWSYSRTPCAGYAVHLTRGHAYMFRLDPIPDPADPSSRWVDALLALWGKNAEGNSVPLAMSDDDAGDRNSVLWFVAPVSGTFELVASSCWYDELGGYRLTMHECPVLGALDTAGTYTFTLGPSPCVRPKAYTTQDTAAYSFLTFPAAPGEAVNVSVDAAAFPPVWELSAPGFDTYANVYDASRYSKTKGIGNTAGFTMGAVGGLVTLAVGATTVDSTSGTFSLTLTRTPSPAPGSEGRPTSDPSLRT